MNGSIPAVSTMNAAVTDGLPIVFCCPRCRGHLERIGDATLWCSAERMMFEREDGIWRMLPSGRLAYYETFLREYETVRRAEGRGAGDPAFYRHLPFADMTGRFKDDWRIRATSYRALLRQIVRPLEKQRDAALLALDLGAGNGWLSNRLADMGHNVVAVDLLTNLEDGLGAYQHYETTFSSVQAEFDHLPFADEQADLVIFNGSLHYSTDYAVTLAEALRVLRPDGRLVVMDSPIYRRGESGLRMVREREAQFEIQYGFASNALPSENFLTHDRLNTLASDLSLQWRISEPDYGIAWKIRPLKAKLRRRREPARFLLLSATRATHDVAPRLSVKKVVARRLLRSRYYLTQRHRYNRLVIEQVGGRPIVVLPRVFNPKLLRSGEFLASVVDGLKMPTESAVLDMGTGSGVCAIAAAKHAPRVVAVDINPHAVRCARINALLNEVEGRVELHEGDLFAPVRGQKFDLILFNPPYFRGEPNDALDYAWRSVDVVERFAAELSDHLTPAGSALVVLSTDGDTSAFLRSFREHDFAVEPVRHKKFINEVLTVYRLSKKGAHADAHSL